MGLIDLLIATYPSSCGVDYISSDYFMNQAIKNMAPFLSESNRMELVGTITAILWVFSGIFPDEILYFSSMSVSILVSVYLFLYSFFSKGYFYDLHIASFRRLFLGGWAHWAYTGGSNVGSDELIIEGLTIPVLLTSQFVLLGLIIVWFSTKYYDQFQDPNISKKLYPLLIFRGIMRGAMLGGLIYAIFNEASIPESIALPYLLLIYLIEPFFYGIMQILNPTMSRFELTMGNARLPSVALRDSLVSNFFILLFTMFFNGLSGQIWELLRVFYILAAMIVFVYSMDAIKRFKDMPLGKNPIADFLNNTPEQLNNLDLENAVGHLIDQDQLIDLGKKSGLNLEPGSIIIPLEESKGKVNALILGKGQSILDTGSRKIGDQIDGVSTALIPAKEFKNLSKNYVGQTLSKMDLNSLELPSMQELKQYVNLLANKMGGFVDKIVNQMNSIDLSNFGIVDTPGRTEVNLGILQVNETPDLTSVKIGGLRVLDGKEATTVRFGNSLTVVDLPKASFVSLPGITVMDISGHGSAVNLFGFTISDGLPADKLEEFKQVLLAQLDRWEAGIDAQLGRYLADKSATGLLSVGWDGEFNLLLDSKNKTMGTHQGLQLPSGKQRGMQFLPPDFDERTRERTSQDQKFMELTGVDPTPGLPAKSSETTPRLSASKSTPIETKQVSDQDNSTNDQKNDVGEFTIIHDVDIEDDEDEE